MLLYILKRILLFFPTLIAVSLLAFIISINAPGDPVDRLLNTADSDGALGQNVAATEKRKQQKRKELGLDLPVFYFSLGTLADVDTLYKITDKNEQQTLNRLLHQTGNKKLTIAYYTSLKNALLAHDNLIIDVENITATESDSLSEIISSSKRNIVFLLRNYRPQQVQAKFGSLAALVNSHQVLQPLNPYITSAKNAFDTLQNNKQTWKNYIPSLNIYGIKNQYHRWLTNIVLRQDFGVSYRDQQPVTRRIGQKLKWSLVLSFFSVLLAYLLSIPIGVFSAYRKNSLFDKICGMVLFMLYSMPSAFAGTLLLVLFANPDVLNWFPESGVQSAFFDDNWPFFKKLKHWAPYLVLPIITYTYSSLAFISRQMRSAMLDNLSQDFIQTARAKGISEHKVIWKHAFRNSLLPVITLFAGVFPMAIGGAVVVETIFGIPGMGLEIYDSIRNYDYPMIVAIFTIFGTITLAGYLLADILYAVADPRISYRNK